MLSRQKGEKSQYLQHNTVEKQTSTLGANVHTVNSSLYRVRAKAECLTLKPTDIPQCMYSSPFPLFDVYRYQRNCFRCCTI